jgi:hypothetical protein
MDALQFCDRVGNDKPDLSFQAGRNKRIGLKRAIRDDFLALEPHAQGQSQLKSAHYFGMEALLLDNPDNPWYRVALERKMGRKPSGPGLGKSA